MEHVTGTALVTGAGGTLGGSIADVLEQHGWTVTRHGGRGEGDLTTPAAARDAIAPDFALIVNAAGLSYGTPADLWRANALLPLRLAEAIGESGSRARLILVGSAAVYGLADAPGRRFRESDALNPNSEYGFSKLAAERLVATACRAAVTARVFNIETADEDGGQTLLARVRAAATSGDPAPRGIDDVRDWVTPDFIGRAIAAIAHARQPPPAVNVCTGSGRSPAEIVGVATVRQPASWSVGDPSVLQALMAAAG